MMADSARDRHDCAHREINASGGNHQGHAEGKDHDGGGAIHDVNQASEETPIAHLHVKEAGGEDQIE